MTVRIRHIARCVNTSGYRRFYEKAFGLSRTPIREGATAWNCYMSDGEVNLALLQYKSEVGSGVPKATSTSTISASRRPAGAAEEGRSGRW